MPPTCYYWLMGKDSEALLIAWVQFFQRRPAYFVTLTFNWGSVPSKVRAVASLREFSRRLDEVRLGSRFYEFPARYRTPFLLVPEKEVCASLHYHGLIGEPDDGRSRAIPESYPDLVGRCWRAAVPSGTADVQPLVSVGALAYSTKETRLTSDDVVCAHDFWRRG